MSPDAVRRRATQRRRRDVFLSLLALTGLSALIGFVPGLAAVHYVALLSGIALCAYVLLLLRIRNVAAEREMKLRFLPQHGAPEPALLLRRSAN